MLLEAFELGVPSWEHVSSVLFQVVVRKSPVVAEGAEWVEREFACTQSEEEQ